MRIIRSLRPITSSVIIYSLIFSLLGFSVTSASTVPSTATWPAIKLDTPPFPLDSLIGPPSALQEAALDAATRNWLNSMPADSTRRAVAELVIESVRETGAHITVVGSWVNQPGKYKDLIDGGTSDHDMRLVMEGATESEAVAKWNQVRAKLIGKINGDPRLARNAQKVLRSINLYPPDVILDGITEPADAVSKLNSLKMNPNLGGEAVEGFWGEGGKVFRQAYETNYGRAIWVSRVVENGKTVERVASGFADLVLYGGEVKEIYTISGTANIASQAVDKVDDALKKYDTRTFRKQLERLRDSLKKARDLSRVGKASYVESLIEELDGCCRIQNADGKWVDDPVKLKNMMLDPNNRARIDGMLRKAKLDSELLRQLSYSSHPRDVELFRNMLEEGTSRWARVRNALSEASAHVPWGPLFKAFIAFMIYIQVKDIWTNYQAGENERIFRNLLADAAFVGSIPAGILSLIVNSIIEDAKAAGYIFVTRYQDCEDLIAGIYEVKGREKVSDQQKIETNIDQLATTYTEPEDVLEVVATHAKEASKRDNTGKITEKVDAKIEEELNKKCGPVILDRWQKRRIELIGAAAEKLRAALDEIDRTEAGGIATPDPAKLKDGRAVVEARANFPLDNATVTRKLQEFVDALKPLGGKDKLVAINMRTGYRWTRDEVQLSLDEQDHNSARPIFDNAMAVKRLEFDSEGAHSARLHFAFEVDVTTIASDVLAAKSMLDLSVAKSILFVINVESDASPTPTPTASPKASPTPSPSPGVSPTPPDDSKVEFGGNVPGIWDGGKNPKGFRFKRQLANAGPIGQCQKEPADWTGKVSSEVWGVIDDWRAPREDELAQRIADITASNKAWSKTTKVRDISISGFKGKLVESSLAWYRGSWGSGYVPETVSASANGWLYKGRHVVEVAYSVSGGGCWNDAYRAFLMAQGTAAQAEANAIINSLTLVEKNDFKKVPYTGPKLDGSDLPKVVLVPSTLEKLKVGDTVRVSVTVENARPEDSPFKYNWGGEFVGKETPAAKTAQSVTIKPTKSGKFALSVSVEGAMYPLGSASLEYEVADYKLRLERTGKAAAKVPVGGTADFKATLTVDGKPASGNFVYRWEPMTEVTFAKEEGNTPENTAKFARPGRAKIWVTALADEGGKLTTLVERSNEIEIDVVLPKLTLTLTPQKGVVGSEVNAKVTTDVPELTEIDYRWETSANGKLIRESQDASEITFSPQDLKAVTITVNARVPGIGDDLGRQTATFTADPVNVTVTVLGAEGPKPQVWREGVGLVTLEKEIAIHQFVGMRADVSPQVDGIRYEWTVNEDSHFAGNNITQQVRLYRSQAGTCEATVVVRDKNGLELGRASGTFSASVTQDALDTAKTKGGTIEKLKNAKDMVAKGQLDEGIDLIDTVVKADPTNIEARDLATKWKNDRRTINEQIAKTKTLIENQRFAEASKELTVAKNLHNLYPPILAVENELNEKAKAFESGVNNAIFGIKAAVDERDYKKALQLCSDVRTRFKLLPQTEQTVKGYEDFARIHEAEKERIRGVLKLGEAKYQNSDYEGALADFAQLWVNFNTYWNPAIDPEPRYYENLRNEAIRRRDRINTLLQDIKPALDAPEFDRGRLEAANTLVNEVLQLQPGNTTALGYRAAIAERLAKGDTKVRADEAIKRGDQLASDRRWADAIKAYDEAIMADPANANAYRLRGRAKREAGDYNGAIRDFNKSLELDPNNHQTWVGRGAAKVKLGDKAGAMSDYDRGIAIKPDYAAGYGSRAALKLDNTDYKGAIADYDRALSFDPSVSAYYANRAYAKAKLGDHRGAVADYTRAIELQPNSPIAYNNRGHSKQQLGDLQGALADFEKALELDPNYETAKSNIAKIKEQLGAGHTSGIASAKYRMIANGFQNIATLVISGNTFTGDVAGHLITKGVISGNSVSFRLAAGSFPQGQDYTGTIQGNKIVGKFTGAPYPIGQTYWDWELDLTPIGTAPTPAPTPTPVVTPKPTPEPGLNSWTGEWNTNDNGYKLYLTQTGDRVSGTYPFDEGKIEGRVVGNKLLGTWSEFPTYKPNRDAGDIEFTMSADGRSFTGRWRYGSNEDWRTNPWNGYRANVSADTTNVTPFGNRLLGGELMTGEAQETEGPRNNRVWPFTIRITNYDPASGTIVGELTWPSLNSVHEIRGRMSGSKLEFTETKAIKAGGAHLNVTYELSVTNTGAAGTYFDPGERTKGSFRFGPSITKTLTPTPTPPVEAPVIFNNTNIYGVYNQPTVVTQFTIDRPHLITSIFTYHWNNARGTKQPGTITLRGSDGRTYGPWTAVGGPGQGGVPNASWTAYPNTTLPAGTYLVIDSDPATWAQNSGSRGQGHTIVKGRPTGTVTAAPTPAPTPVRTATPAPTPIRTGTRYVTAIFENRSAEAVHIFTEGESFGPGNKIGPGERREVRMLMTATGRVKFIAGRNGQVMTTKFWDGDPDDLSRYPRVAFDGRVLLITTGLR